VLRTPAELYGEDLKTIGEFTLEAGEAARFVLSFGSFSQTRLLQSTHSKRWSARKHLGGNRAIAVPMWNRGAKR
jgi:hypothetical protein